MIRIAISAEAFEAIARTLPLGSVSFENKTDEQGNRLVWLDRAVVDRLRSLRGPGESYSDVILRIAAAIYRPPLLVAPHTPPFFAIRRCTALWSSLLSCRRSDILSIKSVSTSLTSWAASRHFASLSLCKPMLRALCNARSGF